jgi:ribokinase
MTAAITVIGDALLDVHVVPSQRPRPGGDVPAQVRLEPGGQGANVAVRLARQGRRVRLLSALGTDAAGNLLRERLGFDGVELLDLGAPATGTVVVLLDTARERTMLSQRMPLARHVAAAPLPADGWLVVSGYLLLEPGAGISASGVTPRRVVIGCSLGRVDAAQWVGGARSLHPHLVIVNADEARALTGARGAPVKLARALVERLGAIAVVTHSAGAAASLDGDSVEVPAVDAGGVVDATGAGDAFGAGLISGLVDGPWPPSRASLERAMTSAITLAAAVARVPGAQTRVAPEGHA